MGLINGVRWSLEILSVSMEQILQSLSPVDNQLSFCLLQHHEQLSYFVF